VRRTAEKYLGSIDTHAAELHKDFGRLQSSIDRLESKVDELTGLEATVEDRVQMLRDDLNSRMLAVEAEIHAMGPSIHQMSRDVQGIVRLLPDPSDGPMARLRDTLTSS
jgi:uncharacterized protein YoxC